MARVTIDELKKMMETERDMTCVLDANNRMMKKNCESMEKHKDVSVKQMEVMEKHNAVSEKQIEVMEKHTEMLQKNTDMMQKYIELVEEQLAEGRKRRSARIRVPSNSSDIMEIPVPPPPEPSNKRAKVEEPAVKNWGWDYQPTPNDSISPWLARNQSVNASPSFASMSQNLQSNYLQGMSMAVVRQGPRNLFQSFDNAFKQPNGGCIYCCETVNKHISEMCPVLRDNVSRTSFMQINRLCLTCAQPNTRCPDSSKCRFLSRKCNHCYGAHLNALCSTKYPPATHFNF